MDWERIAAIAIGGAAGAALRWAVLTSVTVAGQMPWPVLAVNIAGSVLLGILMAEEWEHPAARLWLHDLGGIGFCGGLTTFSTFSVEIVGLIRDDAIGIAVSYGTLSIVTTIGGVVAGAGALRHVQALMLPLEEEP